MLDYRVLKGPPSPPSPFFCQSLSPTVCVLPPSVLFVQSVAAARHSPFLPHVSIPPVTVTSLWNFTFSWYVFLPPGDAVSQATLPPVFVLSCFYDSLCAVFYMPRRQEATRVWGWRVSCVVWRVLAGGGTALVAWRLLLDVPVLWLELRTRYTPGGATRKSLNIPSFLLP